MSSGQTSGDDMSDQPDTPMISDTGEGEPEGERRDVLDAMAVYSADGQAWSWRVTGHHLAVVRCREGDSEASPSLRLTAIRNSVR